MVKDTKWFRIFRIISLILASLFVLIPVIPVFFMAFKSKNEIDTTTYFTPPESFLNFYNFKYALEVGDLVKSFFVTIFIIVITLFIAILFDSFVAFCLSRIEFKLKKLILTMFTLTIFIPVVTTQTVVFRIIYTLGLYNSVGSLILLCCGVSIVEVYIMINLLDVIPKDIDEAAILDGASLFQVFFKIIFPLLKPAIVTVAIIKGTWMYNDFYLPNLYLSGISGYKTITVALYKFTEGLAVSYEVLTAAVIIAIIPVLIAFIIFQDQIYNGLGGAVKS